MVTCYSSNRKQIQYPSPTPGSHPKSDSIGSTTQVSLHHPSSPDWAINQKATLLMCHLPIRQNPHLGMASTSSPSRQTSLGISPTYGRMMRNTELEQREAESHSAPGLQLRAHSRYSLAKGTLVPESLGQNDLFLGWYSVLPTSPSEKLLFLSYLADQHLLGGLVVFFL